MKKNYFLLLLAMACFAVKGNAQIVQPCANDIVRQRLIAVHPEILTYEAKLEAQIQMALKGIDYSRASRTTTFTDETGNPDFWYDIPVVVHFVHDFGVEYLPDDTVFNALKDWNAVYAKENPDTSDVIAPFKGFIPHSHVPYIGNVHIRLHLATTDPLGNPTKGITRRRSYLTYTGGEPSKLDDWPPTSYVNIWVVNTMSAGNQEAAAYAFQPPSAAGDPQGDGIICLYNYLANEYSGPIAISKTINHEMGHVFNLAHPWGNTNNPQVALGDDNVDDTPPTWGHNPVGCIEYPEYPATIANSSNDNSLYDTMFATNYFVAYPAADGGDSVVNYPDTTNAQNIMDYTYCARMFTNGQAARMHAALNSDVAGRNNLWDSLNLVLTGALAPLPDYKPIPDFSATFPTVAPSLANYSRSLCYFTFPNSPVKFNNESWNDTITNVLWTFTDGSSTLTSDTLASSTMKFPQSGWVSLSLKASGNLTGDSTVTWPRAVYVAGATATPADEYFQEFSGSDTANWPIFNYYNNEYKWQRVNLGYDDNNSMEYTGFDVNIDPVTGIAPLTGTPGGDIDDMFSIPMDLSSFGSGPCFLNYFYSGASRSSTSSDITDEMDIDYAIVNAGAMTAWTNMAKLTKGTLDNKGAKSTAYTPASAADWAPMAINIPQAARTSYTVFRFRYKPGDRTSTPDPGGTFSSSGNNFYLDRISFAQWPAAVDNVNLGNVDVAVVPNPASGDAYVVIKDVNTTSAQIIVTDITGKVVYRTSQQLTGNQARVLIPHDAISVQGIYLVQTITGNQTHTQKLVVE